MFEISSAWRTLLFGSLVGAFLACGGGNPSSEPSANNQPISTPSAPKVPAVLMAAAGDQQVILSWSASTGAVSYNIKRSDTQGGPYTQIVTPTSTVYTDTGLTNGHMYYYVVTAVNPVGESDPSSEVSARPVPSAPLNYSNIHDVLDTFVDLAGAEVNTPYEDEAALDMLSTWGFPIAIEESPETGLSTKVRLHWADGTSTEWTPITDDTQPVSFVEHSTSGRSFYISKINEDWRAWESFTGTTGTDLMESHYSLAKTALAIITTNALVSDSRAMAPYAAQRRRTRPVYLVTEDKTYRDHGVTDSSGWAQGIDSMPLPLAQSLSLASTSRKADAIRAWLQSKHTSLGINDVLLIGNPSPDGGDVPMKNLYHYKHFEDYAINDDSQWDLVCWTCIAPVDATGKLTAKNYSECTQWMDQHHHDRVLPTDYYYSNLTYVWPKDADGDIVDIKVTDFSSTDVNVGRLPVYNHEVATMDKILRKFVDYSESSDTAWRKSALISISFDVDTQVGEAMKDNFMSPNGFSTYRIYVPYTPEGCTSNDCVVRGDLSPPSVVNMGSIWAGAAWPGSNSSIERIPKQNFGVIFWSTHGWPYGASDVITTDSKDYLGYLDDSHPAFTVQSACLNSDPYATNNLSTMLLGNGAIATFGATRIAWPGGDPAKPYVNSAGVNDVDYGYMLEMIANKLPAGQALSAVRKNLNWVVAGVPNSDWHLKMDWAAQLLLCNLYGDPTIGIYTALDDPE